MIELTYQNADKTDIENIYQIESRMIKQYEDPTVTDMHQALAWCRTKIEGNYEGYRCICLHGEKAGYYHLLPQLDLRTELADLLLLPQYRKQGIEEAVLTKILAESDETIYVYVFQRDQKTVSLYQKLGFQMTKTYHTDPA
jgi:ribosomal protein S18 acetylase RimI-like enzyme